jgi:hypothetical protein
MWPRTRTEFVRDLLLFVVRVLSRLPREAF